MPKKQPKVKVKITDVSSERELIPIHLGSRQVPDPDWNFVDANGKTHRWAGDELPTLERRLSGRNWCHDCHEWHDEFEWFVPATSEVVEPGYISKLPRRDFVPGPISISGRFLRLSGDVTPGDVLTAAEAGLSNCDGGSIRIASLDADDTGDWDAVAPGWGME